MKSINVERFISKLEQARIEAIEARKNCEDQTSLEAAHWHSVAVVLQQVQDAAKDSSETAFAVLE